MPEFILNRNYMLTTTSGRSIQFVKGKPVHVPPMMVRDAVAIGATPADGSEVDVLDPDPVDLVPKDMITRAENIYEAVVKIVAAGGRKDFTSAGSPHIKAVTRVLGWEPDPREIAKAWTDYLEAQAAANEQAKLDDAA
jgi:hypothetical protein